MLLQETSLATHAIVDHVHQLKSAGYKCSLSGPDPELHRATGVMGMLWTPAVKAQRLNPVTENMKQLTKSGRLQMCSLALSHIVGEFRSIAEAMRETQRTRIGLHKELQAQKQEIVAKETHIEDLVQQRVQVLDKVPRPPQGARGEGQSTGGKKRTVGRGEQPHSGLHRQPFCVIILNFIYKDSY